eukprot:TRINITY_DN12117_c0_g1_i3.p1 TRINITY_DN12117_c0_g1~~TRINITY_DN12117_c0_g1_i3.p1  ORF type:complete len:1028 (-),score=226.41 TRINITY_DN12117_c0_g1_i3:124-3207(-)
MYVYLGLSVASLAVLLLLIFLFRKKAADDYDVAKYQGSDTKLWLITAEQLSNFVKSRDEGWTWDTIGGSTQSLAQLLKTDLVNGLSEKDFANRQRHFGMNQFKEIKPKPFMEFFLDSFEDRTLQILLISAIVSIVLGVTVEDPSTGWIEGTAIFFAAIAVSTVTAGNDYNKDKQFKKLSAINSNKQVTVIRGGRTRVISVFELLVGDLVQLETGAAIPADGIVTHSDALTVDESSLTGESVPREKGLKDPFMLSGTAVVSGVGKMVVISIGMNSEYGRLKAMIDKEHENTPLQDRLEEMADFIGWCGIVAASLTLIALLAKWTLYRFVVTDLGWDWGELHTLVDFIIMAITIVAVAVPEGLPLSVTISLAYSMQQMMIDNNLVRHLAACETMGGATTICSDKTGTLTENKMKVTTCWIGGKVLNSKNFGWLIDREISSPILRNIFFKDIALNSTATLTFAADGTVVKSGTPTECALLELLNEFSIDPEAMRKSPENKILKCFPFSSSKKRMSSVVAIDGQPSLLVKGASEVVLANCHSFLTTQGVKEHISLSFREELQGRIEEWASKGLRTLSFAFRVVNDVAFMEVEDGSLDDELTLLAIVAIEDPIRPEVPDAVKNCQRAGITVRMLTGDNVLTAKNIATQCGILQADGVVLEGPTFRKLSYAEMSACLPNLQVVARCSPEDKLMLVKMLKEAGEVVAVTGDGTNDAPQLTEADVGFAMGIAGTEVAKEACDIILLDDNFNSIMKAVLWGRNVYESIQKFIQFQLTVNVCAVSLAFIGAISNGSTPLKAVQLLWVNLIMDTMAALALATDHPEMSILDRPPVGRRSPLISHQMKIFIVGQAAFQLSLLLGLLYTSDDILSPLLKINTDITKLELDKTRNTILFNTFVFCQLFNEINCRFLDQLNVFKGFFKNRLFVGILVISVVVQILMVQFFGSFAETIALSYQQWAFCLFVSSLTLPWGYLLRLSTPTPPRPLTRYQMRNAMKGWKAARKVVTQLQVINALREHKRMGLVSTIHRRTQNPVIS